jgi:hypothetical protein
MDVGGFHYPYHVRLWLIWFEEDIPRPCSAEMDPSCSAIGQHGHPGMEGRAARTDDLVDIWLENLFNLLVILISHHVDM